MPLWECTRKGRLTQLRELVPLYFQFLESAKYNRRQDVRYQLSGCSHRADHVQGSPGRVETDDRKDTQAGREKSLSILALFILVLLHR
jgi:hypothetical protein